MKALVIEITNWSTGERAGGITLKEIREGGLTTPHPSHQQLDWMPRGDYELRVVNDERDLDGYEGSIELADGTTISDPTKLTHEDHVEDVNGVLVLESNSEIETFIEAGFSPRPVVNGVSVQEAGEWLEEQGHDVPEDLYHVFAKAVEKGMTGVRMEDPAPLG